MSHLEIAICTIVTLFILPYTAYAGMQATLYSSSMAQKDQLRQSHLTIDHFNATSEEPTLFIDTSIKFQQIWGFGAAITDAVADVFYKLNKSQQAQVIDAFFGPEGTNYNIARLPIGSTDFSLESYSLNPKENDPEMTGFDLRYGLYSTQLVPILNEAIKARKRPAQTPCNVPAIEGSVKMTNVRDDDIQILATPWSPPKWMKTNNKLEGGNSPRGLKPEYQKAYAQYVSTFIERFELEFKLKVWAVSPQNEPTAPSWWEACYFNAEDMRDYLKNSFGPLMRAEHPDVKILFFDDQKSKLMEWADICLKDPEVAKFVDGAAFHWYEGPHFDQLRDFHNGYPGFFLFASEQTNGYLPLPGYRGPHDQDWSRGEMYSHDIIGDLNNYSVGWMDWNFILNTGGGPNHVKNNCDAPIIADVTGPEASLRFQPMYYHLVHLARFLPRYSIRVFHKTENLPVPVNDDDKYMLTHGVGPLKGNAIQTTTFLRPDNLIAVVLLNRLDHSYNITVSIDKQSSVQVALPPRSIQTLLIPKEFPNDDIPTENHSFDTIPPPYLNNPSAESISLINGAEVPKNVRSVLSPLANSSSGLVPHTNSTYVGNLLPPYRSALVTEYPKEIVPSASPILSYSSSTPLPSTNSFYQYTNPSHVSSVSNMSPVQPMNSILQKTNNTPLPPSPTVSSPNMTPVHLSNSLQNSNRLPSPVSPTVSSSTMPPVQSYNSVQISNAVPPPVSGTVPFSTMPPVQPVNSLPSATQFAPTRLRRRM